ncbi:mutator type transposase, partial [Tanacetum coccineum]
IEDIVKPNPGIPVNALKEQQQKKYQVGISTGKVKRARDASIMKVKGDFSEQYSLLRDYVLELQRTNEDTTVKIDFNRDYNLSETTRQGQYPGQLLTAVGVDENHGIYHVGYAIVEIEKTSSWSWFLTYLGDDLDLNLMYNFTFISDRQKGILPVLFATTVPYFDKQMGKLKNLDEGACEYLQKIPPQHWCSGRAHCDGLFKVDCADFEKRDIGLAPKTIDLGRAVLTLLAVLKGFRPVFIKTALGTMFL